MGTVGKISDKIIIAFIDVKNKNYSYFYNQYYIRVIWYKFRKNYCRTIILMESWLFSKIFQMNIFSMKNRIISIISGIAKNYEVINLN